MWIKCNAVSRADCVHIIVNYVPRNAETALYRVAAGNVLLTRSQAVARIADRTASQHLWGSRDVIGRVTI